MILAIIPARSGSKGVPNKNVRQLGGYPLIAWSIAACKKSHLIDRIIVSTDSEEYATIASSYGAETIIRPAEISGDTATDYECIRHVLDNCAGLPDLIAHIRPTTPLRDPKLIDDALTAMQYHDGHSSLRSVHEMAESAYKAFETGGNVLRPILPIGADAANANRQSFKKTYSANGYVDMLRPTFIYTANLLHGDAVLPFFTPRVTEVDTEEDLEYLEWQVERYPFLKARVFG